MGGGLRGGGWKSIDVITKEGDGGTVKQRERERERERALKKLWTYGFTIYTLVYS